MEPLPGLDLARFAVWFERAFPGEATGPLKAQVLAGGKSNLTYEVTDGTSQVDRAPAAARARAGHRARHGPRAPGDQRAAPTPPCRCPRTLPLCEDDDVLGAPFYVMEHVDGHAVPHGRTSSPRSAPSARATIATRLVDTLAALHAVDPAAVGLGDFGRPEGFLDRQVRRWGKQLDASRSRDLPGIDELHDRARPRRCRRARPRPAIVHGDYRLDNVLVGARRPRSTAVLDWEMATLGDPLTDLALLLIYQRLPL